ncbi:ribosome maturation factor RimP [Cellulomonas sp. zg-ZUI222]|uniref:Ribosome maturation factor RimP n=1 Tax=Cellulomonas wangleii TaxID=2816956 RepID=A0ABX8D8D5_9CELL|nr:MULTISPECIES: ribosome maturation factor RimP [Cellulomonas]MBO0900700.1 ribosome maturation factor RimP [Cellulomonas sp. zg-ZUI22]MBO0921368.1 ribosome maturation factor RimP [Cellulomonas wangleii]MBO0925784.1 ribosome maturation factor RimP [Cellulomonas wangleii]QVI63694.1 ribosome maturation factor RimP [Cellulomonas wangleii]
MGAPATAPRVREIVEAAVTGAGLLLDDLQVAGSGRGTVVRVVVDLRDEDPGTLDLDRVGDVTRAVSDALDAADVLPAAYTLEVGSPGAERPLTAARHWRRARGRTVVVRRTDGRTLTGRLEQVGDGERPDLVVVPVTAPGKGRRPVQGAPVTLAWDDVRDARVQVDLAAVRDAEDDDDAVSRDGAGRG